MQSFMAAQQLEASQHPSEWLTMLKALLPEVDVAVIENIASHIKVVEGLGREYHCNIIPLIQKRHSLQKESLTSHLHIVNNYLFSQEGILVSSGNVRQ